MPKQNIAAHAEIFLTHQRCRVLIDISNPRQPAEQTEMQCTYFHQLRLHPQGQNVKTIRSAMIGLGALVFLCLLSVWPAFADVILTTDNRYVSTDGELFICDGDCPFDPQFHPPYNPKWNLSDAPASAFVNFGSTVT